MSTVNLSYCSVPHAHFCMLLLCAMCVLKFELQFEEGRSSLEDRICLLYSHSNLLQALSACSYPSRTCYRKVGYVLWHL